MRPFMWLIEVNNGTNWYDASGINGCVTGVIMRFDMRHIDRFGDTWYLI